MCLFAWFCFFLLNKMVENARRFDSSHLPASIVTTLYFFKLSVKIDLDQHKRLIRVWDCYDSEDSSRPPIEFAISHWPGMWAKLCRAFLFGGKREQWFPLLAEVGLKLPRWMPPLELFNQSKTALTFPCGTGRSLCGFSARDCFHPKSFMFKRSRQRWLPQSFRPDLLWQQGSETTCLLNSRRAQARYCQSAPIALLWLPFQACYRCCVPFVSSSTFHTASPSTVASLFPISSLASSLFLYCVFRIFDPSDYLVVSVRWNIGHCRPETRELYWLEHKVGGEPDAMLAEPTGSYDYCNLERSPVLCPADLIGDKRRVEDFWGRLNSKSKRRQEVKMHKRNGKTCIALALLASIVPVVSAESCIPLSGSTQCPAFNSSSISTGSALTGLL